MGERQRLNRNARRRILREQQGATSEPLHRLSKLAHDANVSLRTLQRHAAAGLIDVVRVGPKHRLRVTESTRLRYLGIMKPGGDDSDQ
jgi:hypothetical protein